MENISILGVFNLLPSNLENSEIFRNEIENELYENGNINAHEVFRIVNRASKVLSEIVKSPRFKDTLFHEMDEDKEIYGNYSITKGYSNSYNYEKCNDSEIVELNQRLDSLKEKIKKRENFLKAIPEHGVVNEDTGEVIEKAEMTSTLKFTVRDIKPKAKKATNHLDNILK